MGRQKRELRAGWCYHVTVRCNSREFRLTPERCRRVVLFSLKKAVVKFGFTLFGLCIMSNHVHYLLKPQDPEDLPRIMHWINWYVAMCLNRILGRTGHFWEKRYHSEGFDMEDYERALNTLRYIHANPQTAGMQQGFFYEFSNYGMHANLTDDGLTEWHPAFLELGETLEACARVYKGFCKRYKPKAKPVRSYHWGKLMLAGLMGSTRKHKNKKKKKRVKGQMRLDVGWEDPEWGEVEAVSQKFMDANRWKP